MVARSALAESIGTDNTVSVGAHGTFGVLSSYNDQFTKKGHSFTARMPRRVN